MSKLPLNLIYLKYFCDAVKYGSISSSARENFVSQSAISQGISVLERSLEKDLITHQTNRFKPTQDGMLVFEKSRHVFEGINELESSLEVQEGEIGGKVDFACMHSYALACLPSSLIDAKEKFPKLKLTFRLAPPNIIMDMVKKGIVDFGIVLDNDDLSGFDAYELYSGHYKLYRSKNKPLRSQDEFILSEERIETNLLKKSYQQNYGKPLKVLMEVSSWEVIACLTEQGLGVGFFPDYVAIHKNDCLQEVEDIKFDPIPYKIYGIFSKARKVPENVRAFLDLLSKPKC